MYDVHLNMHQASWIHDSNDSKSLKLQIFCAFLIYDDFAVLLDIACLIMCMEKL
jgi:hypothetical protein